MIHHDLKYNSILRFCFYKRYWCTYTVQYTLYRLAAA